MDFKSTDWWKFTGKFQFLKLKKAKKPFYGLKIQNWKTVPQKMVIVATFRGPLNFFSHVVTSNS